MLIKKIGGNWHKIQVWKEWVIGYKSGGIVILKPNLQGTTKIYIPFYDFNDFTIDRDYLFIRDNKGEIFRVVLDNMRQNQTLPPPERVREFPFTGKDEKAKIDALRLEGLPGEPRAVDDDERITAVAYTQKGIDFFLKDPGEKIAHFDFPGYSFIDDIKLQGNRLYIADVFGLRILDISNLEHITLDDRFTAFKGWPKDMTVYKHYLLVADVLGIKIYDKQKDFAMVGKIESNRNRVAKVITKGDYAFLSCEAIGLKVADLSDIVNPRLISGIVLPKGVWDCDVYEGYAYLAAYTGGLLKIDCSDIKNLKKVGSYTGDEEVIGVHVNERAVYAACSHGGLKIFDHQLNLKAEVKGIQGRCWTIVENDGYLFIAAGKGGVYIYDVNEPEAPVLMNRIQTAEARDLFIQDRLLYIADGQNGALICNISNALTVEYMNKIPSAAFTRGIMVDESYIYKADGDGGVEVYENERPG
jgi:hypothetical protein